MSKPRSGVAAALTGRRIIERLESRQYKRPVDIDGGWITAHTGISIFRPPAVSDASQQTGPADHAKLSDWIVERGKKQIYVDPTPWAEKLYSLATVQTGHEVRWTHVLKPPLSAQLYEICGDYL
jgi:hypothetical protein